MFKIIRWLYQLKSEHKSPKVYPYFAFVQDFSGVSVVFFLIFLYFLCLKYTQKPLFVIIPVLFYLLLSMSRPLVTLHTNHGDITLEIASDLVPETAKNFIELARRGYYNGTIFHRVIRDFMIQGGDPTGTGRGGESIYGEKFSDEFHPDLTHVRGAISMANAGPNTNGSQFFIVHAEATPWLDGKHSVFGHVVESVHVLDDIASVQTDAGDRPFKKVEITGVTIKEA
jgi:cyclophilin family peptidyl-prolyl cis-trans isomerase